jgi:hypothetical protein
VKVLFDHGTPVPLRHALDKHVVSTAYEMGWSTLDNRSLLKMAEKEFDVLVTTDQSIRFQQNLAGCHLAVLVLPTTSWPKIQAHLNLVTQALDSLRAGDLRQISFKD